jgi:hypothetical protein
VRAVALRLAVEGCMTGHQQQVHACKGLVMSANCDSTAGAAHHAWSSWWGGVGNGRVEWAVPHVPAVYSDVLLGMQYPD